MSVYFQRKGSTEPAFKYKDYVRRPAPHYEYEEHYSIRLEDLQDVLDLIEHDKIPDAQFGDTECAVWEMVRRTIRRLER